MTPYCNLLLALIVTLTGCGFNGTQRVEISDSKHKIDTEVNINFTFIQQLITLCQQSILVGAYPTAELYNQAVAQCVLHTIPTISQDPLCQPGLDLSSLPLDQQQAIQQACALGSNH